MTFSRANFLLLAMPISAGARATVITTITTTGIKTIPA